MLQLALLALFLAVQPSFVTAQDQPVSNDPVRVSAGALGVANLARVGDWAGIEIEFEDTNETQRELIIQIEGKDSDGDSPLYQRTVTSNPGVTQRTWLYLWIPGSFSSRDTFLVSVYEAVEQDAAVSQRTGVSYTRGALLTRTEIGGGKNLLAPEIATGLVIGRRVGGLADYSRTSIGGAGSDRIYLPNGHEITLYAGDVRPDDLPDRAIGLSQFETIVWTTANPSDLTLARSNALIEWVRRGGHLVVVLPSTGQVWFDSGRNPLASLIPDIIPSRLEPGTSTVRALLTHDERATLPDSLVIQELAANASAEPTDAVSILTDAEGRTVVSRRLVDLGMVTLVGIDVTNRNLADRGLPAMDAFWHRIFGRRAKPIDRNQTNNTMIMSRDVRYFDSDIGATIASSGSAGAALLLGFALFALYWAIGGPLGYVILNQFSLKKHSWLAFIAAIGLFTLIGWGGVSVLRPRTAHLQQIAFLDAVEGSNFQRVRAFSSVFVPGYADAGIRVGEPDSPYTEFNNTATHWQDGFTSMLGSAEFPDARAYPVSARDPELMRFPARATEKTFRFDWAGPSRWPTPKAVEPSGRASTLSIDSDGNPVGSLIHNLPVALRDVTVIVAKGQKQLASQTGLPEVADFSAYKLTRPDRWQPETTLNLAELVPEDQSAADRRASIEFFNSLSSRARSSNITGRAPRSTDNERLIASAFVSQMEPPSPGGSNVNEAALRRSTHGLDLGKWLTEPCIIVLGVVEVSRDENATNPIPIFMQRSGDWNDIEWSGKVVVRWVYPLRENPPEWPNTDQG
ncbi:MAG: hypothetical protein F6K11_20515 [Leptolyngbya sp. SIO3F4]|nr:hypothetical protein [Leptolyngbya sp. SIO3F4]